MGRLIRAATAWVFCVLASLSLAAHAQVRMDWRLTNNFPLFKSTEALDKYLSTAASAVELGAQVEDARDRALPAEILKEVRRVGSPADTDEIFHRQEVSLVVTWVGGPAGNCIFEASGASPTVQTVSCDQGARVISTDVMRPWKVRLRQTAGPTLGELGARVRDITVVGLGDSYAAGEGNPDVPALLGGLPKPDLGQGGAMFPEYLRDFGWTKSYWATRSPVWLDGDCHRSLYSHQVMSMARLAKSNPKVLVRFAHWACSGAEIFDGLIEPQRHVPGGGSATISQLDLIVAALCGDKQSLHSVELTVPSFVAYRPTDRTANQSQYRAMTCAGKMVRPDLLLLSVGGNDVGFAGVVISMLAPAGGNLIWRNLGLPLLQPVPVAEANKPLARGWLRQRFDVLELFLRHQFGVSAAAGAPKVLQLVYPSPLHTARGYCSTRSSLGADSLAEALGANRWRGWNLRDSESREVVKQLIEPLQSAVYANVARSGWFVADTHLEDFKTRGFCSPPDERQRRQEYLFPKFRPGNDPRWFLMQPEDWQPYASKSRWLRMPNDSFLTQIVSCPTCIKPDTQRFRGTAHPNAWGQARLAQSVLREVASRRLVEVEASPTSAGQ